MAFQVSDIFHSWSWHFGRNKNAEGTVQTCYATTSVKDHSSFKQHNRPEQMDGYWTDQRTNTLLTA